MASFQSTLADRDVAEELASDQRQISIAEFFEKNKQMLGFDSEARALVTAVKEGVDNSLDAAEEAGFLPDVYVEIRETGDYYTLVIEDNGPGITKDQIPSIFGKLLYGSRFHKREQSLLPDQQVLVKRNDRVELAEIGNLCDAYIPEAAGGGTARVADDVQAPCFDRETGQIEWHDVTHAIRHETDHDTLRIETTRNRAIEVTENHSLFALEDGEIVEVEGNDLSPGDHVVAPERIPPPEDVDAVNLLKWVPRSELDDRRWYVYGVDRKLLETIREEGTRVRKPASEGGRDRTYYRYNGVDVMKDSLEVNYLEKGYLPAGLVKDLGWEDRVADGTIRTYQVGGDPTEVPVTVDLTPEFMRFLGLYVAEGHADAHQVGFTFGSHEQSYIEEIETTAAGLTTASTTTVERERNSTRVKAFASPLAVFLQSVCGDGAKNKHVPPFVFRAGTDLQQAFLDALYDGDGCDAYPSNQRSLSTTSERLAREVSYLWSMRGIAASWKRRTSEPNISGGTSTTYHVLIHGEDLDMSPEYDVNTNRSTRYRQLPSSVVGEYAVDDPATKTVPATKAGVLLAAGLGSQLTYAKRFLRRIEYALDGGQPPDDYYRRTLESYGLLTPAGKPTDELEELYDLSERLVAFGKSDLCLLEVTDVEPVEAPEYVYDISVPGTGADENFVAGNQGALCVKNSRGQQGIGISAAVMYAQLTSGTPAKITSRTPSGETAQYFELVIDTENNEPEIREESTTTWERPHGTRIELRLEGNMRARGQLHDYITHTAVVNPHARIELVEPDAEFKFDRATDELPDETESIRPHPHGVELGTLIKMLSETDSYSLSGFLQGEFTRVGGKTGDDILDAFRDRYFGRGMAWRPPKAHDDADVETGVRAAVANKGAEATRVFAADVAERVGDADAVARHDLVAIVDEVAAGVEEEFDTTFGATVRENAVDAAWEALTADRAATLYDVVDGATSDRKDEAIVRALADRIADKFADGPEDDRVTRDTLATYVDRAADMTVERDDATIGDTARENVVDAIWDAMETVPDDPPTVGDVADDRDAAADLLEGMRAIEVMAPPTNCLAPIRAELIEEGLRKGVDADFYAAETRSAEVHGGDPFIVEAGIAYGGDLAEDGPIDLMRFANRVPLVYQRGACATTDVVKGIDWRNYGLDQPGGSGMPGGPAVVMIHVASTNVPFTSESKDAVANIPAIEKEIELAVREAARELKSHLNERRSLEKRRRKQTVIADILPKMATKVATVTGREEPDVDGTLAKIMNNVLVTRRVENGTVELVVRNYTDAGADLEVTDIVTIEPDDLSAGTAVDVDDEWFVKWNPRVEAGETATLSYAVDGDASYDVTVEGIETEKLTIHQ